MLDEQEKTEVQAKLQQAKLEASELKKKLGELNVEKEAIFEKKKSVRDKIMEILTEIKSFQSKRNSLTKDVRSFKGDRDVKNKEISDKIAEIKVLKDQYKALCAKHNVEEFPKDLDKRLSALEFALETQVISFEKEKQLMKEIKALKKKREELKGVNEIWKKIKALSKDIDRLKSESNMIHKKVQETATESQGQHETLITESKKISDLKTEEEQLHQQFMEKKTEFTNLNAQLKEKISLIESLKTSLGKSNDEIAGERRRFFEEKLEQTTRDVEEKLKKRQKLTTEDILVFQANEAAPHKRERRHKPENRRDKEAQKTEAAAEIPPETPKEQKPETGEAADDKPAPSE